MAEISRSILRASPGDRLVIHGHYLGEPDRDGEIVEVHGHDGAAPYTVRWADGHVSRFYPSSDASVQHFEHPEAAHTSTDSKRTQEKGR